MKTALEEFVEQIVLKKDKGSIYLVSAICDFQIENALKKEKQQTIDMITSFANIPDDKEIERRAQHYANKEAVIYEQEHPFALNFDENRKNNLMAMFREQSKKDFICGCKAILNLIK